MLVRMVSQLNEVKCLMKKFVFCITLISIFVQLQANSLLRLSVVIGITAVEFLALQAKYNIFDVTSSQGLTAPAYLKTNLNRSFATFTGNGPLVNGTELKSLAILVALCAQNYFLCREKEDEDSHQVKKNIGRAIMATALGGIIGWGASLAYGATQCS